MNHHTNTNPARLSTVVSGLAMTSPSGSRAQVACPPHLRGRSLGAVLTRLRRASTVKSYSESSPVRLDNVFAGIVIAVALGCAGYAGLAVLIAPLTA